MFDRMTVFGNTHFAIRESEENRLVVFSNTMDLVKEITMEHNVYSCTCFENKILFQSTANMYMYTIDDNANLTHEWHRYHLVFSIRMHRHRIVFLSQSQNYVIILCAYTGKALQQIGIRHPTSTLRLSTSGNTLFVISGHVNETTSLSLWQNHLSLFSTLSTSSIEDQDALRDVWERMKRFH
jgi:hypothetical protein